MEQIEEAPPAPRVHVIGDILDRPIRATYKDPRDPSAWYDSRSRYTRDTHAAGYKIVGNDYVGMKTERTYARGDLKASFERAKRSLQWKND